jgi:hypothetical protein
MTATADPATEQPGTGHRRTCPACGSVLAAEQEWCLECGTATTIIHSTPPWWIPVVVVAVVVLGALVGFIYALGHV